jgi:hypothetical protein
MGYRLAHGKLPADFDPIPSMNRSEVLTWQLRFPV